MKYSIDYQFLPMGASRPCDDGVAVGIEATDESGVVVLPNVGDFVNIQNPDTYTSFSGKVRSRLFNYIRIPDGEVYCGVNIVVEEVSDGKVWGELIKE